MEKLPTSGSTYGATRAWLACVGACAAKQDAVNAKKTAREVAAEMIESKLFKQDEEMEQAVVVILPPLACAEHPAACPKSSAPPNPPCTSDSAVPH